MRFFHNGLWSRSMSSGFILVVIFLKRLRPHGLASLSRCENFALPRAFALQNFRRRVQRGWDCCFDWRHLRRITPHRGPQDLWFSSLLALARTARPHRGPTTVDWKMVRCKSTRAGPHKFKCPSKTIKRPPPARAQQKCLSNPMPGIICPKKEA